MPACVNSDSPSSNPAPSKNVKVPKADDGGDLLRAQSERGIGAIANRPAAQRVQADVVADGVAHERDQAMRG